MPTTTLQKITTRAKQIRKAHPSIEWKVAIKRASKDIAGKKTKKASTMRVKKTARKTAVKAAGSRPKKRTATHDIAAAAKKIETDIGDQYVKFLKAKNSRAKKKAAVKLREQKAMLKRLKPAKKKKRRR